MCNCMVLDVTAIFFWITAFLKKLPFLAEGLIREMAFTATMFLFKLTLFQEH